MRRRPVLLVALVVAGALVILVIAFAARAPDDSPPTADGANATVERVIDGDTVDLDIGGHHERVRLIGIDTPESVDPRRPVECYGPQASKFTASLLPPGTQVRVERDVEPRDDYGRLLAYVFRAADGLFVNLDIVEQGYAVPLRIAPNTLFADRIVAAAKAAQRADRGLWGACDG